MRAGEVSKILSFLLQWHLVKRHRCPVMTPEPGRERHTTPWEADRSPGLHPGHLGLIKLQHFQLNDLRHSPGHQQSLIETQLSKVLMQRAYPLHPVRRKWNRNLASGERHQLAWGCTWHQWHPLCWAGGRQHSPGVNFPALLSVLTMPLTFKPSIFSWTCLTFQVKKRIKKKEDSLTAFILILITKKKDVPGWP